MTALNKFVLALTASTALCAVAYPAFANGDAVPVTAEVTVIEQVQTSAPNVTPVVPAATDMPGAVAMGDTVLRAIQTHPQIKAGRDAQRQAEKGVVEERSGFFPVLGVESQFGHATTSDLDTRALTGSSSNVNSWYGSGTVSLTQPIFSGMSTVNRLDGAKGRYQAVTLDLAGTEEDVALRAARAHLNLMRTRDLLILASNFIGDIDARHNNIALMVQEGAADEAELLQANEIKAAAYNSRLAYEEAYRQAEAEYIEVTGEPPAAHLAFGAIDWTSMLPSTIDVAVNEALKDSPRILAADKMTAALDSEAKAEKGILSPRLDAAVSHMRLDQKDDMGGESNSTRAMLKLGWSFSTGGAEQARIDRARAQAAEARSKREDVMRRIEYGARQKFVAMHIADQQFGLLSEREEASRQLLENFTVQFEGGRQTNLQLIAAASRLFEAQAARTDAYYRKVQAQLELLNVMGKLRSSFGAGAG